MRYLLLLGLLGLTCFSGTVQQDKRRIEKVLVVFMPKDVETPLAISAPESMLRHYSLLSDTIIKDTNFINDFEGRLLLLKSSLHQIYPNIRIACFIEYKSQSKLDTLCLEEQGGIYLNGIQMQNDSVLFNLITNKVWKDKDNQGKMLMKDNLLQ